MRLATRIFLSCSAFCITMLLAPCGLGLLHSTVLAQTPVDEVTLTPSVVGRVGIALGITAGASGAPGGFTVSWMTLSDFVACGSDWDAAEVAGTCLKASFTGVPTKHTAGGTILSYVLDPSGGATVEIGDLFDETGVTTEDVNELEPGTTYVMSAYANEFEGQPSSTRSTTYQRTTDTRDDCLLTQGFWKTHPLAWPVTSLTLGTVTYTQAQLLSILNTPAQGNGLIFLAHQLIATKLNIASGASGDAIAATIAASDILIGGLVVPPIGSGYLTPSSASTLTNTMDDYNNGEMGSEDCQPVPVQSKTWGQLKVKYF